MIIINKSNTQDIKWPWKKKDADSYIAFKIEDGYKFIISNNNEEVLSLMLDMTKDNYLTFSPDEENINLIAHFGDISSIPVGEYDYEVYVKSELDDSIVSESGKINIEE